MPRPCPWTDADLRSALPRCTTMAELCAALGVRPGGVTYERLRRRVGELGLDASHLPTLAREGWRRRRRWSDDDLRRAVERSVSLSEVLRRLGYRPSGGMHRLITGHIRRLGLDTSHFTGRASQRGRRLDARRRRRALETVLVAGDGYRNSADLRERLIRAGLKEPRCESCGLDRWRGRPMRLQLDHVNGDPCDNRIENLRILCPNCHSLTDTWCRQKSSRRTPIRQRGGI